MTERDISELAALDSFASAPPLIPSIAVSYTHLIFRILLSVTWWCPRKTVSKWRVNCVRTVSYTHLYAPDFYAENIPFENSSGPVGQAVACFVSADRVYFKNCRDVYKRQHDNPTQQISYCTYAEDNEISGWFAFESHECHGWVYELRCV